MSGPLRVGIDGRSFSSPAAGVRRYVANLVPALIALDESLEMVALGGRESEARACGIDHVAEPPHLPTNLGWTLVGLPRAASTAKVDLIHAPAYTAPLWAPAPVVLTIHDVSYERHPEWYPYRRDWVRRAFYRRSARAAAHILTDSSFSSDEIEAAYGISRGRITVAPLGVSARFAHGDRAAADGLPPGVAAPYLLHVGDLHDRRNVSVVIEALSAVRNRGGATRDLRLVLAGVDRGLSDQLRRCAADKGVSDALASLGTVSDADLESLYRHAAALVYPSLYEGFGLPVLEAMASGTPVIASKEASIPEVLGDAGILLDPFDARAWTDAIAKVVNDGRQRAAMQAAGRARAAGFTWERTARTTLDVYRRAAAR